MQHNVQLLHWPADRARRESLDARARPCVWIVASGEAAPDDWGPLEDWVRDGTDERDLAARIEGIKLRAAAQPHAPAVDKDGVLWWRDRCASLAPVEARLMGAFLASIQRVVNHDTLLRAGWPDEPRTTADLATRIKTLRRKIRELDMSIVTLPGRGYLIDVR